MNEHKTRVNAAEAVKLCRERMDHVCVLLREARENGRPTDWLDRRFVRVVNLELYWLRRAEAEA